MEKSYETFEEELGPPRADPPPQKPVRQIRRPEMYAARKVREEVAPVPQQPRAELRTLPREPSFPRISSLQKPPSIQSLSQVETPWENVTLNRCLFVAITILVLTSGFQRLHETLRGRGVAEEEEGVALTVRRSGTLRHRGQPPEPETTLWEVIFSWLPDLGDEEDEEEDDDDDDGGEVKRGKSKRGGRNKPLPARNLLKRREGKLKERRAKKEQKEEIKDKIERDETEEPDEAADNEEEDGGKEEAVPVMKKTSEEQKKRKKTQKG